MSFNSKKGGPEDLSKILLASIDNDVGGIFMHSDKKLIHDKLIDSIFHSAASKILAHRLSSTKMRPYICFVSPHCIHHSVCVCVFFNELVP